MGLRPSAQGMELALRWRVRGGACALCLVVLHGSIVPAALQGQTRADAKTTDSTGQEDKEPASADESSPESEETRSFLTRARRWFREHRDDLEAFFGLGENGGFFPEVGIIVAGSGLSAGGGYRKPHVAGSPFGIETGAMFSTRGYEGYRLLAGVVAPRKEMFGLRLADAKASSQFNDAAEKAAGVAVYADLRYRDYPQHVFFGIGPDAQENRRADFRLYGASYDAVVEAQLSRRVGVAGRVGLLDLGVGTGRDDRRPDLNTEFLHELVPGLVEQSQYLTIGLGAAWDGRDAPGRPRRGSFLGGSLWRFDARGSGQSSFTRAVVDGRTFVPSPFASDDALALRALVANDFVPSGGAVPFFLQNTLGGTETLRGFSGYRFRDRALIHLTAEYRWDAHRFLEIAPFVDVGTVASHVSELAFENLEASPGIGVRVKEGNRVFFRLDWAVSREGHRLSFATGPIF
jgi:Omp85 superfamily domain